MLALLMAAACGSAQAQTLGLAEACREAQANDPAIRAARATLDIARQRLPQARAGLMPVVAFSGGLNSTQASTSFANLPPLTRDADAHAFTLQLTQPLFRPDGVLANQQAPLVIDNAQALFDQAMQDLLLRVATAYFAVSEAHDGIVAADAQVGAMTQQLEEMSRGFAAGTRAVTDVDDTRARLGTARAQQVSAHNDLENAMADLERILDSRPARLAELPPAQVLPSPRPAVADEWVAQARETHPRVAAQRAALEIARYDVERARSGHLPTVDLVVNIGRSYSNHSLTTPDDYSTRAVQHEVGVQLNVPLFAGGAVVAKVREAESGVDKARADLDAASRDAANDALHAFNGVTAGLAQIAALEIAVQAGERSLKGSQAGARVGYRTNVDVLNAQQQLYAARRDLSKARYDVLLQELKLKAAAGALAMPDLEAVDALLNTPEVSSGRQQP